MRPRTRASGQQPSQVPAPAGLKASVFRVGRREFAVLEWASGGAVFPESLSPAERDVSTWLLAGCSNREIAWRRGTSPRTVANQLAQIFRKLGVQSRHELLAATLQRRGTTSH